MPQPDVGDVHVNALLTNMSIGYKNEEYVADRVFPNAPVRKQSDIIPLYDRDMWLRSQAAVRAPGTLARRSGFTVDTTNTYFARNFAIGAVVTAEERENADPVFNLEVDSMEWAMEQILLAREVEFASAAFGTGIWTTDRTGGTDFTKFSSYGSSDPIGYLRSQVRTVRQIIGRRANVVAMGEICWDRLADHPDIIERIKGAASPGSPAIVSRQLLASLLELDEVVVASALQVTSEEGATETRADVIDDDMLVLYRPPRPSLKLPAGGYNFTWNALMGGGPQFIRRYEETDVRQTVIEAHSYFDYNVTAADAGVFLADAVD